MDPIEKRELKRQAWMRLTAQKRRAGLLRGRVVALSLICFALLWGIVFVQMATGNDPVLSAKKATATNRATASAARKRSRRARLRREEAALELEPEVRANGEEVESEFEPAEPLEPVEPEFEEVEPEFIEEPLVTSQS
jgi:hypothetical protein